MRYFIFSFTLSIFSFTSLSIAMIGVSKFLQVHLPGQLGAAILLLFVLLIMSDIFLVLHISSNLELYFEHCECYMNFILIL